MTFHLFDECGYQEMCLPDCVKVAYLQLGRQLSDCGGGLASVQAVVVHLDLHPAQAARQLAQRALRWQRLPECAQQPCPLSCYVRLLVLHMHCIRCSVFLL